MRSFFAALAVTAALAVPVCAASPCHFDDAALRAVQFVDPNEGWAVGDDGAIWHTIDGGKHWERQPSGVRASLRAVHFLTPFTGWIVGREELPQGAGSVGVILVTRDGGLKWQRISVNALPGLNCVRFFDGKFGIVAGDGSDQFPSGVFSTADGGHSWKPLPGARCPSWLAADFHKDAQVGALAGAWSRLAAMREGSLLTADVDTLGGRSVHGIQLMDKQAVAVGEGGLVLVSANSAGQRWGFADLKLPAEALACMDFQQCTSRGDHVWVVGRPGSVVLHSPDRGQSWHVRPTGQALPLNGVFFLNEQLGWAVGELGTVLTTSDGGRNWSVQRQGGQRSAVLFIHARPTGVPLGSIALLGEDEGYLATALQVTACDPASAAPRRVNEAQRLTQAVRLAGGAGAETLWQFPLPDHLDLANKLDLLRAWDRLHANHAADQLLRQLVLALRVWQPDVVVTAAAIDRSAARSPLDALMAEAVQEAYLRAADPKAFPEQIEHLGLKPWKVGKLYGVCDKSADAAVVHDLREEKPGLHGTPREFAAPAAGILSDSPMTLPSQAAYRLLASRVDGADKHRNLMQGVVLAAGGTARRALEPLTQTEPDDEKAAHLRRDLQTLAETPVAGLTDPNQLLGQIGPMLKRLPGDQGAVAAFAIANQFARAGQWVLAREAFLLMVDRYPAHPLSTDAYRWLIRHAASSEARRRQELGQFLLTTQVDFHKRTPDDAQDKARVRNSSEAVQTQQLRVLGDMAEARRWYEGALTVEPRLAGFGPLFANDPAAQFCLQAARRNLGKFDEAKEWYTRFLATHKEGPWHDAAEAELWLANRSGPPPKSVAICRQAVKRPFLDGSLDDACWQGLKPLKFRNAIGDTCKDYPTEAWLAYDKEFLYLALRCQHPADQHVPPVKVRHRDADLRAFDRVSLLIDLDRDYNTYFQLQIDQRGCLCEDCWGDKSWNPRWFVATRSDATSWQIEAAIPLGELTGDPVTVGKAWACNLVRVLPGRGVQAWSTPADVEPRPEGMGLMLFSAEPKQPPAAGRQPTAN